MKSCVRKLLVMKIADSFIQGFASRSAYWTLPILIIMVVPIGFCAIGQDFSTIAQSHSLQIESLPKKVSSNYIPNLIQVHVDVYSGGQPEGEAAFKELRSMGFQTIISVDGVTPNVAAAESYQMRYVHLPHGYDGISDSRMLELAKAIRDLPKPIYIHCHHGKHRSPTAASTACVLVGLINKSDARSVLEIAGTGKNYVGLFATVERAKFDSTRDWSKVQVDFQVTALMPPMTRSMVSIDHHWSRIQTAVQSDLVNDNSLLRNQKNIDTHHDLLMLKELYVELTRGSRAINDIAFSNYLHDGVRIIDKISLKTPETLTELEQNCKACHQLYRDTPNAKPE